MFIIRPIRDEDYEGLKMLAESTESGLTTLPNNEHYLKGRISDSLRAFHPHVREAGSEIYLFVMEDLVKGKIAGICGIAAKVGGFKPFYTYKINTEHFFDEKLKIKNSLDSLVLTMNHDGPSEICSLFISPDYRRFGLGRLLSLSRFMFMANFTERFDKKVISEIRGTLDINGSSPFWEAIGRHFFKTDFSHADFLTGLGQKEFIKNLLPKHPIYISLLAQDVQNIIGKPHRNSEPAYHLLMSEGFQYLHEVDIFDAGPTLGSDLQNVKTIKESQVGKVTHLVNDD